MVYVASALRLLAGFLILAVLVPLFATGCLLLLPSRLLRIRLCNLFGHIAGRAILAVVGVRVDASVAREAAALRPAIYVSNHTSALDVFLGIWLAPYGTVGVAKKEVVRYPLFGQLYLVSGHLRVDRGNHARAVAGLARVAELMRRYRLGVWMWPEGTRSADGRLQSFKKGFAHMALATGLPVVPIAVGGAHRVWRKRSFVMEPAPIAVRVLAPIPTTHWRPETLDEHVAEVRAAIEAALPEDQRPAGAVSAAK